MHRISTIAYDGYMYWWVCTCGAHGRTESSSNAAHQGFALHAEKGA